MTNFSDARQRISTHDERPAHNFTNPERQLVSIAHIITRAAEVHPDRIAIDDLLNGVRLSYRELDRRVCSLARALRALGIGKNDIVATMFYNEIGRAHV